MSTEHWQCRVCVGLAPAAPAAPANKHWLTTEDERCSISIFYLYLGDDLPKHAPRAAVSSRVSLREGWADNTSIWKPILP